MAINFFSSKSNKALILILIFAAFWRFIFYPNRWVLNQDQARDVVIALASIKYRQLVMVGSPSSAGPFSFGPLYHYLVLLSALLFPFSSGPWVAFTLLSLSTVYIFYLIGKNLKSTNFGFLLAALTAFSPGQVENSTDMLNTVITSWSVSLAFYFIVKFNQKHQYIFAYLAAFFVGFTQNAHFQSLGLFSLLLTFYLVNRLNLRLGFTLAAGWLTAFIPLIIFDLSHGWPWLNSVLNYYLHGQNRFFVPIRWLTDILDFWPHLWGKVVSGQNWPGYFILPVFVFLFLKRNKKINKSVLIISFSLLIQVFLLRYYKGVRSREYLIVFHPFIIFLTGWTIYQLRLLKIPTLIFILIIASISNYSIISHPSQAQKIQSIVADIRQLHPGPYAFYTNSGSLMVNFPIFYLLYQQNLIDTGGFKIATDQNSGYSVYPLEDTTGYDLITDKSIYNIIYINYPQSKYKLIE